MRVGVTQTPLFAQVKTDSYRQFRKVQANYPKNGIKQHVSPFNSLNICQSHVSVNCDLVIFGILIWCQGQ